MYGWLIYIISNHVSTEFHSSIINIHFSVFRNGDALFRGVRVLLPRKIMNSWEHVSIDII